ncbi:hypothetical protein GCM10029992_63340 [Glycomyces albus]
MPAAAPPKTQADEQAPLAPLTGYTVAVTAQRRADELATLLERRGARTVVAPTLRIVPLPDDEALRAATVELIREAPDLVVATTGIGFRGWLEAAEGWGMGEDLLEVLESARILCRGPKALGAVRAAGLTEEWTAPSETGDEVVQLLKEQGVNGQRVAIQLHGDPAEDFIRTVREGGERPSRCRSTAGPCRPTSHPSSAWWTPSAPAGSTRSPSRPLPPRTPCCASPATRRRTCWRPSAHRPRTTVSSRSRWGR